MLFQGLDQALEQGCTIRAYTHLNGVRFVEIGHPDRPSVNAESRTLEGALAQVQDSFQQLLAGRPPLSHRRCRRGSALPTGPLDQWILDGHFLTWEYHRDSGWKILILRRKETGLYSSNAGKTFVAVSALAELALQPKPIAQT